MEPMILTILIFLLIVILLVGGKAGLGVVGVLTAFLFQVSGVLTQAEAWSGFSNSSVIMFAALFVMGAGLSKSNLVEVIKQKLMSFKGNQQKILLAFGLASIFLSIMTNSTATVAALTPVIILVCKDLNVSSSRTLKPCCDLANMWTGVMPIGAGASMYLTANSVLEQLGRPERFSFFDLTIAKLPLFIISTIYLFFIGYKLFPVNTKGEVKEIFSENSASALPAAKNRLAYLIYGCTVFFMVLSSSIKNFPVPIYLVACIGALLYVFTGILTEKQAVLSMNIPVLCLVAGLLPVATAFNKTGAGEAIGALVQNMLGGTANAYVIAAVFFIVPLILTQFMNNIVVANLFMSISATVAVSIGINPVTAMIGPLIAGNISLLTPMASAPQIMTFGAGGYSVKDYLKGSLPTVIICFIVYMVWVPLIFPLH